MLTWVFFAAVWLTKWGAAGVALLATFFATRNVLKDEEIDTEVCKTIVFLWLAAGMLHYLAK